MSRRRFSSSANLAWATILVLAMAGAARGAPVAFVDHFFPAGAPLGDLVRVENGGRARAVVGNKLELEPGDQLFVARPDAVITVRYLANNALVAVRKGVNSGSTGGQADLTLGPSSLPALTGTLLAWMEQQLSGAGGDEPERTEAVSRSIATPGVCFNAGGQSNEPAAFAVPILSADKPQLVAGERSLFISWRGGAAPFSVTLAHAEDGSVVTQSRDIRDACFAWLPQNDLAPGRYVLTVTDGNGVKEEEDDLSVVASAPQMPAELRDAALPGEARQLYFATWLSAIDAGDWAFEAEQRVAAMDCASTAARDWLQRWGDTPHCGAR